MKRYFHSALSLFKHSILLKRRGNFFYFSEQKKKWKNLFFSSFLFCNVRTFKKPHLLKKYKKNYPPYNGNFRDDIFLITLNKYIFLAV